MGKEILTFNTLMIKKDKFYRHKSSTFLEDTDTEQVLVSNNIFSGEKNANALLVTFIMIIKLNQYI